MSEFWWGVLALPIIVAALGLAAIALFGGWLLLEKWYEYRFDKMEPVSLPEQIGKKIPIWTLGSTGQRGRIAANILARPHAYMFQPFKGHGALIYVGGTPHIKLIHTVNRAIDKALLEVAKEEA